MNNYNAPHSTDLIQRHGRRRASWPGILHVHPPSLQVSSPSLATRSIKRLPGVRLLQSLRIVGDVNSRERSSLRPRPCASEASNIDGHYLLANGDATLRDFRASLLGGEVTAQGTMRDIGGDSRSKFDATLPRTSQSRTLKLHDGLGSIHRSCRNRRHTQRHRDSHVG